MSERYSLLAKGVDAHYDAHGRILIYILHPEESKRMREFWVKALRGLNGRKVRVSVETTE